MGNYEPIAVVHQLRAWVEENSSSSDSSNLAEAKQRYRAVTEIIGGYAKLNKPVPEDVRREKENLEAVLNAPDEWKTGIKALLEELQGLANDIKRQLRSPQGEGTAGRQRQTHTKGPRKTLKVTMPNGTTICEHKAVDTFVGAIQAIGVRRVAGLQSVQLFGWPLVSRQKNTNARNLHELDGFYIETCTSTERKKQFIEMIASELEIEGISASVLD